MAKAINDATENQMGTMYQYLIALRDCFDLEKGEVLQIETNGDISTINGYRGRFQKEVKHHLSDTYLSDRDVDFWKTLANWYVEYDRIKNFSHLILSTTAKISDDSSFSNWNSLNKEEKLNCIKDISAVKKSNEKLFRSQYNRIFNDEYNETQLLEILEKFTIEYEKTSIVGISNEFEKFIGHIPDKNRDYYIGALLGQILIRVKDPPHKWEVSREDFEKILQAQSVAFVVEGTIPLPKEYAKASIPEERAKALNQKHFVEAIREIEYESEIPKAISDYWKAEMTIANYFKNDLMYLESLDSYRTDLSDKMQYSKSDSELEAKGATEDELIKISKRLYNGVMKMDAKDFGSIIRNQSFFQRGVIHNIVDETDFRWKVEGYKDEYK